MGNPIEKIVLLCKKRDRKGQELLYQQFSPILFSICLRYADNYEDAQDTFQEGFILIFNKIDQYNFEGSFEGWMKKIMVNLSLDKYRKNHNFKNNEIDQIPNLSSDEDNDEFDYEYDEILSLIQTLPSQYRQVFNLYVIEDYSHQEIADLLQISVGTSKSNLSRARSFLKQKLHQLKSQVSNEQVRSSY
ncbi:MAG: sigma-70 family RNA polymerase sigma factor [Weeksellaceae bacterium]|nr:sigma-70 family RNA polymerase sigma factor [Weeksellaceae bacterium]